MNEQSSRTLDVLVGIPLCWLLTLCRRLRGWLPGGSRVDARPPRKILFVKLAEMGAIVLTMPAFQAAAKRVGRENLLIVMLAGNREVHDLLGIFLPQNVISIRDHNLFVFAWDAWQFLRRCRRDGVDAVVDLEGFARISAILSFLTGARIRVGLDRHTSEGPYRGDLFTHRIAYNYYNHASVQFLTMIEALDADPRDLPLLKQRVDLGDYRLPLFAPSAEETREARAMIAEVFDGREPPRPWIILNCNLIDLLPLRRWPEERFYELGRRILAEHPTASLLLTGLPAERELSRALAARISPQRARSLAGETKSLRSLVTLFTQADLMVTSDCGPGHMAALTDLPVVSIFGPETPQLYAPLSPHNHSLWAGLACSPCLIAFNHRKSNCRRNVCMDEISVEQAYLASLAACAALRDTRAPQPA